MHYFPSRQVAGSLLADELEVKYRFEDCAVIALGDGGVVVGAQIAMRLHCVLTLLLTAEIKLQGESQAVADINHLGGLTYNSSLSSGELDEIQAENFNYLEQQKMTKKSELNRGLGRGSIIRPELLKGRNVIVVSDGLVDSLSLHAVVDYVKPIKIQKLIVAVPFASVAVVDQMHVLADELLCLNTIENVISIDHYYEDNAVPPHDKIIQIIEDIILHWQ